MRYLKSSLAKAAGTEPVVSGPVGVWRTVRTQFAHSFAQLIPVRRDGGETLFVSPDGSAYALNDRAEAHGVASIEPIRLTSGGHKVSLGAMRSMALKLC